MNNDSYDLVIEPKKKLNNVLEEIAKFKDLFYFLALRDFKVRYKQMFVGVLWAFLRPLLTLIIFTVIFNKVAGFPSDSGAPYSLMVIVGMLPWFFFSSSFQDASNSLVLNANMVSKIYFPRIIIPASSMIINYIDFLISSIILCVMMIYFRFLPSLNIVLLPIFFVMLVLFTLGASMWMSALNVKYRDVKYLVPFIIQLGLYVSPVGFSTDVITNEWRLVYSLNPIVSIIDGFRWCVIGGDLDFYWPGFLVSVLMILILFVTGYRFFMKSERNFADVI